MKTQAITSLLVAAVIGLAMSGCSESKPSAPKSTINEIKEELNLRMSDTFRRNGVKPFLTLDSLKSEAVPLGRGEFKINLEITWRAEEALYAVDEIAMEQLARVPNSITLLKEVSKPKEKITTFGSVKAEQFTKDRWELDKRNLEIKDVGQKVSGLPIGAFPQNSYIAGTPEAGKAIEAQKQLAAELEAKARREAEERRIREQKEAQERAVREAEERRIREERTAQERRNRAIREAQQQRAQIEREMLATKENYERQIQALKAQQEQQAQGWRQLATMWQTPKLQMAKAELQLQEDTLKRIGPHQPTQENIERLQANIRELEKEIQGKIDEVDKSPEMQTLIKQTLDRLDLLEKETQEKLSEMKNQVQETRAQEEKLRQEGKS